MPGQSPLDMTVHCLPGVSVFGIYLYGIFYLKNHIDDCLQALVAIIGPAGTGKSYLFEAVDVYCTQKGFSVTKLATTGVSAYLIEGQTVHSFLRMDVECQSYLEPGMIEYDKVLNSDVIIIDEFSMLELKVLLAVEKELRKIAVGENHRKLFGGRHVILAGDPCQLPAIEKDIFGSSLWYKFDILLLKDVMRQKDHQLLSVLNDVRYGHISDASEKILQSRMISQADVAKLDPTDPDCTIVVSTRKERDHWNIIHQIFTHLRPAHRTHSGEKQ